MKMFLNLTKGNNIALNNLNDSSLKRVPLQVLAILANLSSNSLDTSKRRLNVGSAAIAPTCMFWGRSKFIAYRHIGVKGL